MTLLIVCVGPRGVMEADDGEREVRLADLGPIRELAPPAAEAPDTPAAAALAVIRTVAAGDAGSLLALVTEGFREKLVAEGAAERFEAQARFFRSARYEVGETAVAGDGAEVTVAFEIPRGEQTVKLAMLLSFTRVEGRWLLAGLRPKGR